MKNKLLVIISAILLTCSQTISFAETSSEMDEVVPSNSNQIPMQRNMEMNNGMGNMNGMNNHN